MATENNNKTLNVPNLRFPEFSGEWEHVALSEIAARVTRKNKDNASKLPLTISAQYGLVDQISFFNKVVASADMSNYYLLRQGEFAYNKSYSSDYPWGAIKRLDRYPQGALSSLYICFAVNDKVDSDFAVHYFESSKWHREVSNIAGEGARNHGLLNIAVGDFFDTKHRLPSSKEEQKKIAALLNLITERIATQIKIIEDLKKLKSAISNKLFARKDLLEKQITISEIGTLKNGYAFQSSTYNPAGNHQIITIANVSGERYIDVDSCNCIMRIPDDIQVHQVLKKDDILISLTGNVGRVSLCIWGNCLLNQRVGLLQLKQDVNREYVYQALSSKRFEQAMIACGQGAAQMNIGKGDVEDYTIPYSCNVLNMELIASTLKTYDLLISVEVDRLRLFYQQKQYLLAQMFI